MCLLLLLLIFILILWCLHLRFSREGRLIAKLPGPKGLPILGNAFQFIDSPENVFKSNRELYKTYKSVIMLYSLNFRCLNIYDPEDIGVILSSAKFHEKDIPYNFFKPWLNDGILLSKGIKWHSRRKMLTPAFHLNVLKNATKKIIIYIEKLPKTLGSEVTNNKTDLSQFISRIVLDIICETAIGEPKRCGLEDIYDKYIYAIAAYGKCLSERVCRIWYFFDVIYKYSNVGRNQKRIVQDLHALSQHIIRSRRQYLTEKVKNQLVDDIGICETKGSHAFIDLLLKNEKDKIIDECGIKEEVDGFLFASYDTTSTALTFFIMRIANEPKVQEKIQEEIDNIFGNTNRSHTFEDLNKMKYTECCIKESLRIYPSVPYISRHLRNETVLGGYTIPAKTQINIMIFDLHRRADIYPEPDKFIPERFLSSNNVNRHPYAYIPFSAGFRNCIGQKLAMIKMKVIILGILGKYRVEPVTKYEEVEFCSDIVLRPSQPLYVRFRKRK